MAGVTLAVLEAKGWTLWERIRARGYKTCSGCIGPRAIIWRAAILVAANSGRSTSTDIPRVSSRSRHVWKNSPKQQFGKFSMPDGSINMKRSPTAIIGLYTHTIMALGILQISNHTQFPSPKVRVKPLRLSATGYLAHEIH